MVVILLVLFFGWILGLILVGSMFYIGGMVGVFYSSLIVSLVIFVFISYLVINI